MASQGDISPDLEYEYAMLECGVCQSISLRVGEMLEGTLFRTNLYPPRVAREKPAWSRVLPL